MIGKYINLVLTKLNKRIVVRALLLAAFSTSVIVIFAVLLFLGLQDVTTWTTIAASSAVITSVISAWNGQRVVETQEDAQQPHPYPFIDASSRYQLLQLRITNFGGSSAHDVRLEWNEPVLNFRGEPVRFTTQSSLLEGAPEISVLLPNQSIAAPIDTESAFFNKHLNTNYSGQISFKDDFGKCFQRPFYVSAEQYRQASSYEEEEQRTHHELQKIPKKLEKLAWEVKRLRGW